MATSSQYFNVYDSNLYYKDSDTTNTYGILLDSNIVNKFFSYPEITAKFKNLSGRSLIDKNNKPITSYPYFDHDILTGSFQSYYVDSDDKIKFIKDLNDPTSNSINNIVNLDDITIHNILMYYIFFFRNSLITIESANKYMENVIAYIIDNFQMLIKKPYSDPLFKFYIIMIYSITKTFNISDVLNNLVKKYNFAIRKQDIPYTSSIISMSPSSILSFYPISSNDTEPYYFNTNYYKNSDNPLGTFLSIDIVQNYFKNLAGKTFTSGKGITGGISGYDVIYPPIFSTLQSGMSPKFPPDFINDESTSKFVYNVGGFENFMSTNGNIYMDESTISNILIIYIYIIVYGVNTYDQVRNQAIDTIDYILFNMQKLMPIAYKNGRLNFYLLLLENVTTGADINDISKLNKILDRYGAKVNIISSTPSVPYTYLPTLTPSSTPFYTASGTITYPSSTFPSTTFPSTTFPSTTFPSTTFPSTTFPSTLSPYTTLPYTTLPSTMPSITMPATMPSTTMPSTTMPSTTMPSTTMPSTTIPSTTMPATTMPATTMPSTTIPSTTMPATTMPATTMPIVTYPSTTMPYTVTPYGLLQYSNNNIYMGAFCCCCCIFCILILIFIFYRMRQTNKY
jgi:hypothetical protein